MGFSINVNGYMTNANKDKKDAVVQNIETLQNSVLTSINTTAENADKELEQKQQEYDLAMGRISTFQQAKNTAFAKYTAAKLNSKTGKESILTSTKNEYNVALQNFSDAEMNSDVLRSSLMDCIFYAGRINNSATVANSIIG